MDYKLASRVTVDFPTGNLWIDDMIFPFHISPDVEIEGNAESDGYCTVWVGILAESARMLSHLIDDQRWLADVASRHRAELGLPPAEVPA